MHLCAEGFITSAFLRYPSTPALLHRCVGPCSLSYFHNAVIQSVQQCVPRYHLRAEMYQLSQSKLGLSLRAAVVHSLRVGALRRNFGGGGQCKGLEGRHCGEMQGGKGSVEERRGNLYCVTDVAGEGGSGRRSEGEAGHRR